MTLEENNDKKSCRRVPFLPVAGLGANRSENQFYNQISLPRKNGTIFRGRVFPLRKINGSRQKRAAFCSFSKGSLTVEASICLSLFLLTMVCIISMIHVYGKALERTASLRDTAMTAALAAGSGEDEKEIRIDLPVSFRPYYFPAGSVWIPCRACVRAWNGRDAETEEEGKEDNGEYVYVTDNRSVFHTSAKCTHLELDIQAVDSRRLDQLRNQDGSRYHSCEKCRPSGMEAIVYVTPYGDCFHSRGDCSGLKRTIRLVSKEEVGDSLCQCSRCAAKAA